jgi:centrosomal protein CEP135
LVLISDSVASQHEAEERAETLAKCNKHLEKELQDVDQMALAVEAECSSTVKESSARAEKYQVRMEFFVQKSDHRMSIV